MRPQRLYDHAGAAFTIVLMAWVVTPEARAQAQACANPTKVFMGTSGAQTIEVNKSVKLALVDKDKQKVAGTNALEASAINGTWKPETADSVKAAAVLKDGGMVLITRAGRDDCVAPIDLAASPTAPPAPVTDANAQPAAAGFGESYEACRLKGQAKETETGQQLRGGRRGRPLVILFYDDGSELNSTPCFVSTSAAAVGDLIVAGVYYPQNQHVWSQVQYEPCPLESASPNILQTESKQIQAPQAAQVEFGTVWFTPRRCYAQSVVLSVKGRPLEQSGENQSELKRSYPIDQYQRYRATIQTGVLFSPLQQPEFGLRPNAAGESVIFDKGPDNRGPEYMASVVLYGLPWYIRDLFGGGHYSGRDPVNEQKIPDRIGGVLGVGLLNPGKSFMAGFAVEGIAGVNGIAVLQFRKVDRLADGVAVEQPFAGTADAIPLHTDWEHKWVFGLSLDLRYVTQLFGSRQ
jgi:hypothetical protein